MEKEKETFSKNDFLEDLDQKVLALYSNESSDKKIPTTDTEDELISAPDNIKSKNCLPTLQYPYKPKLYKKQIHDVCFY